MKNIYRAALGYLITSYILLQLFKDFFLAQQTLGSVLVIGGAVTGMLFVLGMFVFLFRNQFESRFWKLVWFFTLLFPYYLIGPVLFYCFVYEMGKTLSPQKLKQQRDT